MRRHDRRDGVRRPAGSCTQHGHSGGTGAPPGTTTSPCQELADDLGVALKTQRPNLKRGPVFANRRQMSMRDFCVRYRPLAYLSAVRCAKLCLALKQRSAR